MCPLRRCDAFLQYSRPAVLYPNFLGTLFKRAQLYYVTKMPQISPTLAVNDGNAAIEFYKTAFGATVLWRLGGEEDVVAGLSVQGAQFFLATEAPAYGTRSPAGAGFTTVRIELSVDDPVAVHRQAVAAGAIEKDPVREHTHTTAAQAQSKGCCKELCSIPLGTSGSSERFSNDPAQYGRRRCECN